MKVDIFFDGASSPIGSKVMRTGIGIAVYLSGEYSETYSYHGPGDEGSNNIAEWSAARKAFEIAQEIKDNSKDLEITITKLRIYSDSQLVVNQYMGIFSIKEESFKKYKKDSLEIQKGSRIPILWIPRKLNKMADNLSKLGIGKTPNYKRVPLNLDDFREEYKKLQNI